VQTNARKKIKIEKEKRARESKTDKKRTKGKD
jgi:hypothetical protein